MIQIITGPPCGGKSTYIRERAKQGDIVIDMDRIALALTVEGTEPFRYTQTIRQVAYKARAAAVTEALRVAQGERYLDVYIIHTDPSPDQRASYRAMNGRIIECDPGKDVCLERLKSRPEENQKIARTVIDDYYRHR